MADNRTPRDSETREATTSRKAWAPASALPEFQQKDGWSYRWVRTSMLGASDPMNVSSRMREGWEPVKRSDHPEMILDASQNPRYEDSVEVGGLILCKMPAEFVEQRTAYYNGQTKAQTEAVDNNFMRENDARMPLFSEKKTSVSFGKGK